MPIARHSYDEDSRVYEVQFKAGGPVYRYLGVDPEAAGQIQNAPEDALGKTIQNVLVQGSPFEFERVAPDDTEGGET